MPRGLAFLVALAVVAATVGARAETAVSEAVQRMAGPWEISNLDRDRRCSLTFSARVTPVGFRVALDSQCKAAFPSLGDVVGWQFGEKDVLRLVNIKGAAVMRFTEVESGLYESERGADGLLFLQTQAALMLEIRTVEQIIGDWTLLREAGKPLCRLTLSGQESAPDRYRVLVKPGCDLAITTFNLRTWQLDRDQLVLTGREGVWRFFESQATVWERVPLSVDPLLLVRQ
jgi:hypothetical protein